MPSTKKKEWFTPATVIQIVVLILAGAGIVIRYESRITSVEERLQTREETLKEIRNDVKKVLDEIQSLYRDYDLPPRRNAPGETRGESRGR